MPCSRLCSSGNEPGAQDDDRTVHKSARSRAPRRVVWAALVIDVRARSLARIPRVAAALHPVEVMSAGALSSTMRAVTKAAPAPDAAGT